MGRNGEARLHAQIFTESDEEDPFAVLGYSETYGVENLVSRSIATALQFRCNSFREAILTAWGYLSP